MVSALVGKVSVSPEPPKTFRPSRRGGAAFCTTSQTGRKVPGSRGGSRSDPGRALVTFRLCHRWIAVDRATGLHWLERHRVISIRGFPVALLETHAKRGSFSFRNGEGSDICRHFHLG